MKDGNEKMGKDKNTKKYKSKKEYWAFISYRHLDNKDQGRQWATWLQHQLENYEVPEKFISTPNDRGDILPERIYPIFRDETDLPANADLPSSIKEALERSKFMLVLCSPNSVKSKYVHEEILYFKQLGKADKIFAILIKGEPNASRDENKQRTGISLHQECIPKALMHPLNTRGELNETEYEDPMAADLRLDNAEQGWTNKTAYQTALAKLGTYELEKAEKLAEKYSKKLEHGINKVTAGILGLDLRDLIQEEAKYLAEKERKKREELEIWLNKVEAQKKIAQETLNFIKDSFNSIDPVIARTRDITISEVFDNAYKELQAKKDVLPEFEYHISEIFADVYDKLGKVDLAYENQARAVSLIEKLGEAITEDDIVTSYNNIGFYLINLGRYEEAKQYHNRNLAMLKKKYPKGHPDIAATLNNIGMCLYNQKKYDEAIQYHEQTLEICKKYYSTEHTNIIVSLNNIATCLDHQQKHKEAMSYYTQALEKREKIHPEDHPDTAIFLNNIGSCLSKQEKYEEAMIYHIRDLKMLQNIYPENHPDIASSLNNIGMCLSNQNKHKEALPYFKQSLEMLRKIYSKKHPNTAASLSSIGWCLYHQNKHEEAIEYHKEAFEVCKQIDPENHSDATKNLIDIGGYLYEQEKYKNAILYYTQALEIYKTCYSESYPGVADNLDKIAMCYHSQNKYEEAIKYYEQALEKWRKIDKDHPNVSRNLNKIGGCLYEQGKYGKALTYYTQDLEILRNQFPEKYSDIASNLNNIGVCLSYHSEHKKAIEHHLQALKILQNVHSQNHPDIAMSFNNIGGCLHEQGKYQIAMEYYIQALEMLSDIYPDGHPSINATLKHIQLIKEKMKTPKNGNCSTSPNKQ